MIRLLNVLIWLLKNYACNQLFVSSFLQTSNCEIIIGTLWDHSEEASIKTIKYLNNSLDEWIDP